MPPLLGVVVNFKLDFIGKKKFKGILENQFRGEFDTKGSESGDYFGRYKVITLIPFPKNNDKINAVLVEFYANENSEIKDFEDFENKGIISKIWNTFRYIE